jgi:hypothetical protein
MRMGVRNSLIRNKQGENQFFVFLVVIPKFILSNQPDNSPPINKGMFVPNFFVPFKIKQWFDMNMVSRVNILDNYPPDKTTGKFLILISFNP